MVELSNERIEQILHEETKKTEDLTTILRGIYSGYMNLYEQYFADIEALNDDQIAELKKQHEETKSLIKYYYMDIPQDICEGLHEFDDTYNAKLLGADWRKTLFDSYSDFCAENDCQNKSAKSLKAAFSEQILDAFYETMDDIFREGFGTGSKDTEKATSVLSDLLFEGDK